MTRLLFQLGLRSSGRTPGPVAVRPFSIWGPSWRYPPGGFVRLSHFGRARSANPLRAGRTHTILSHAARHEAPDRDLTVKPQRPNHRASRSVRFGDQGVVGNIDPIILKADPIMAVFRVPIGVCDALTICHRAAESSAALQIVEPLFCGCGVAGHSACAAI